MKTRTMAQTILAIGWIGWLSAWIPVLTSGRLALDPDEISSHLLFAVAPTLIVISVQVWILVFAWLSRSALVRASKTALASAGGSIRPILVLTIATLSLTLANFVVGFLTVTGGVSVRAHVVVVASWLLITAVTLLFAYRGIGALESEGDRIARVQAP